MSAFDINPSMLLTISALLDSNFPAIQSTDNKPTPMITPITVALAYIQALIIGTVSLYHSDAPHARHPTPKLFELRSRVMVRYGLQKLDPAVLRSELMTCFTSYYEGIFKMKGASDLPLAFAYRRSFNAFPPPPLPDAADGIVGEEEKTADEPAAEASAPAAAPVVAAPEAEPASAGLQ